LTSPPAARIRVFVKPGSSRTSILGWSGAEIAVALREKPIEGRANESLCALLAGMLGVAKTDVEVASGAASRHKSLRIIGWTQLRLDEEIRSRFGDPA
jgi:uncharacterized protein (TIGR00251 family)